MNDQSAHTTARVVSVAYRLWLSFFINRVLNLTKLSSVIHNAKVNDKEYYFFRNSEKIFLLGTVIRVK